MSRSSTSFPRRERNESSTPHSNSAESATRGIEKKPESTSPAHDRENRYVQQGTCNSRRRRDDALRQVFRARRALIGRRSGGRRAQGRRRRAEGRRGGFLFQCDCRI